MGGVLGPGGGCDFCPRVIHPHLGCYLRRLGLVKIYIYIYIYLLHIFWVQIEPLETKMFTLLDLGHALVPRIVGNHCHKP